MQNSTTGEAAFTLRGFMRVVFACAACAIALWALFLALTAIAVAVPDDARIERNLLAAVENEVLSTDSYPRSPFGHTEHQFDMYSDCVGFTINLSNQEEGLLRRMALTPTAAYEANQIGPCGNLATRLRAGDVHADKSYLRFWHGYQIYVRPLLSVMSLDTFRRITAALFFCALLFFTWRLALICGPWAWAAMLAPFFLVSDFLTAPSVATHALSLSTAFALGGLVPLILKRVPNAQVLVLPVFAFAAGAFSNYFNFLINPPLAPALIALAYLLCTVSENERRTRNSVLYAGWLVILFFGGFATAWIEKWLFAAAVLGPDTVLGEITNTVDDYEATRNRMGVDSFLGASRRNIMRSWDFAGAIALGAAIGAASLAWLVHKHGKARARIVQFLALMAPLAVIVLWVEANRAHSAHHSGFVSRSFLLFGIIPMLAALKLWRDAKGAAAATPQN